MFVGTGLTYVRKAAAMAKYNFIPLFILLLTLAIAAPVAFADRPASSGTVTAMSDIHMDINNIFFDKIHHFSVTAFDVSNVPVANEPCVYWTEFKATGNVLETYETKQGCILGLAECYYTTNTDGNLFGQLNITDNYYDIGREYTLRVSCGTVSSSIDFNILTWKTEETTFEFWGFAGDNSQYLIMSIFGGLIIVVVLVIAGKFIMLIVKA